MNKERIKKEIRKALQVEDAVITDIRQTPGGLTNNSYFVTINDEKYIARFAGRGTKKLIDRKAEKCNLLFGTELGINPALIYFDITTGMKITQAIEGATSLTPSTAREDHMMKSIISLFRHLHNSEKTMENHFNLFNLMDYYEKLVESMSPLTIKMIAPLKEDVMKIKGKYESLQVIETPCHIDAECSNLILSGKEDLSLIDWEYSGMFDPLWDLATLFQSLQFTEEEEMFFITYYLERKPTNEELQRLLMHAVFQNYLWYLWTVYKEASGDDFGSYGMDRYERTIENIGRYKSLFQEDDVG